VTEKVVGVFVRFVRHFIPFFNVDHFFRDIPQVFLSACVSLSESKAGSDSFILPPLA
jgi:hypothetical protein